MNINSFFIGIILFFLNKIFFRSNSYVKVHIGNAPTDDLTEQQFLDFLKTIW
jgi:hypothetical protein